MLVYHHQLRFIPGIQKWFNIQKSVNMINKMKQNHMIFSINAEIVFDKIHYLFMIKILKKVGIEGTYLSITKTIYMTSSQPTLYSMVKAESFSFKTRMSTLAAFIQHNIRSPRQKHLGKKKK